MELDFEKSHLDAPKVVLIDGAWGSGKSLIAPLVSSFVGHAPFRIDQTIEVLTAARSFKKISQDAYRQAVISRTVESHFNNLVGREINLRFSDDSAFQHSLGWVKSFSLLFGPAHDRIWRLSMERGDAFVQLTHLLGLNLDLPLEVFKERIKVISVRRNPLFMFKHWENFLLDFDRSREVTPSFRHTGVRVPFFARSWADEWVSLTPTERAIVSIARYQKADFANPFDSRVHYIYFDNLLKKPLDTLTDVRTFLDGTPTHRTSIWLKKTGTGNRRLNDDASKRPEMVLGAREQLLLELRDRVDERYMQILLRAEADYLNKYSKKTP